MLHTSIVAVWNFHDPHGYLYNHEFRTLVVTNWTLDLISIPTGPWLLDCLRWEPLRALCLSWQDDRSADSGRCGNREMGLRRYQLSGVVLQRFIAYILVLQTLCLVSDNQELSRRVIKLAVASYYASPTSGDVHNRIQGYGRKLTLLECADRDTLDKIVELMELYRMDAKDISAVRAGILTVDSVPDEPW